MDTAKRKMTNPKDAIATTRVPFWILPSNFLIGTAVALYEGACKYGAFNYRKAGVRASVYYTAVIGHLTDWWEGENIDPDSGLSHLYKAAASLAVLIDAKENSMMRDDRPPASPASVALRRAMFAKVAALQEKHRTAKPRHYTTADGPTGEDT